MNTDLPQDRVVMVFDGVCVLCSGMVRWIIARDPDARIAFASAQGPMGQSLYANLGLSTEVFDTFLLVSGGRVFTRSDGVMEIMRTLGGAWRLVLLGKIIPRPIRDWAYDRIAQNRYRWFGRTQSCLVPDAAMRARFL